MSTRRFEITESKKLRFSATVVQEPEVEVVLV
jgi:hypothetical protein